MESGRFKKCFIPKCINNSQNSAKIFIHVPSNKKSCTKWFDKCGRKMPKNTVGYYCCEDHFTMNEDCENWAAYKLIMSKIVMKKDVVPHKNLTECNVPRDFSQLSHAAKMRKMENIKEYEVKRNELNFSISILPIKTKVTTSHESDLVKSIERSTDKEIQVRPMVTTVAVQTE